MDEDITGGGSGRLGKKPSESGIEVDYKTKAGTAWSHSYLNQKPWHPLSYPNQRRKWIAEQTNANRASRAEEVAREFAQEQEFFRQTALFSQKEKEKVEMMKAVSFMYVRPPGYNPESAKAAEIADEQKRLGQTNTEQNPTEGTSSTIPDTKAKAVREKKPRPKDVFGRPLPTEEEFEVLKNAPRLETGVPVRIKPFAVEVRNVRCVRCGTFGHQSGDRECPLKDVIMPNEESRLKRDDPLTAIMAQTDSSEPMKWELKQKPGMSPPRGGFRPDDPNQQIVAEDIFDEYGGFLGEGIPSLLSNISAGKSMKHPKQKSKNKKRTSETHNRSKNWHDDGLSLSSDFEVHKESRRGSKSRIANQLSDSSSSSDSEARRDSRQPPPTSKNKKHKMQGSSPGSEGGRESRRQHSDRKHQKQHRHRASLSSDTESDSQKRQKSASKHKKRHRANSSTSDSYDSDHHHHHRRRHRNHRHHRRQSP
ncbi:putative zinc finger CCHC domain-containing protein At4g19190 [Curcuma longa]|uniref:putative zinc finger CCHC domain-containing protein At4g19190 n=1 Tax=Curcuma longa TaxID=136217 RepID=UPI003D9EDAD1